jgi:hypothetical protein
MDCPQSFLVFLVFCIGVFGEWLSQSFLGRLGLYRFMEVVLVILVGGNFCGVLFGDLNCFCGGFVDMLLLNVRLAEIVALFFVYMANLCRVCG